jgi:hypothetical protein
MFRDISEINERIPSLVQSHYRELRPKRQPKVFTYFCTTEFKMEL